jgi:hypothetical protein
MCYPSAPVATGSSPKPASDAKTLNATRRRLSVMSDNKLVEGMDSVAIDAADEEAEVSLCFILDIWCDCVI